MSNQRLYVGIDKEINGGMTDTAKVIRDAWVFGLIPESETCEGWTVPQLETLWQQVDAEWERYGFLVGNLPEDLRERFMRIQDEALERARAEGWDPDAEVAAED